MSRRRRRHLDDCLAHLRERFPPEHMAGLEARVGGKHFRITAPAIRLHLTCPLSPSDHRWFKNWKTQVKYAYQAACERQNSACRPQGTVRQGDGQVHPRK